MIPESREPNRARMDFFSNSGAEMDDHDQRSANSF